MPSASIATNDIDFEQYALPSGSTNTLPRQTAEGFNQSSIQNAVQTGSHWNQSTIAKCEVEEPPQTERKKREHPLPAEMSMAAVSLLASLVTHDPDLVITATVPLFGAAR